MMLPPTTNMRLGMLLSSSAPAESTMRSSFGMKGVTALRAGGDDGLGKLDHSSAAVGRHHLEVVRIEEGADTGHHLDLRALAMPARPPVSLLITPSLNVRSLSRSISGAPY